MSWYVQPATTAITHCVMAVMACCSDGVMAVVARPDVYLAKRRLRYAHGEGSLVFTELLRVAEKAHEYLRQLSDAAAAVGPVD